IELDDLVERVRDLAGQAGPAVGEPGGEIALADRLQHREQGSGVEGGLVFDRHRHGGTPFRRKVATMGGQEVSNSMRLVSMLPALLASPARAAVQVSRTAKSGRACRHEIVREPSGLHGRAQAGCGRLWRAGKTPYPPKKR